MLLALRPALPFLCLLASAAMAQDSGHMHSHHMTPPTMMESDQPREAGQSAFAAIQEIVSLLSSDPATDWSRVDIEGLRQHLIDMNNVTLAATVETVDMGDRVKFLVSGQAEVRGSIQRMVEAHAATMNGVEGWEFAADITPNGAALTAKPPSPADKAKLLGLGFIGVMTVGMHHQQHHLMIARGNSPH